MGTRNLVAVYIDGEYKVAQYGQWDGYPDGQGLTALEFLLSSDMELFKEKVRLCRWITQEEYEETWASIGVDIKANNWMVDIETGYKHKEKYPEHSRDTGAKILELIYTSVNGVALGNSIDFAHDGLSCEWGYVIDFDKNTFEVFKGFSKEPLGAGERFYEGDAEHSDERFAGRDYKYYGIRNIKTYQLDNLPSEEMFLSELNLCECEDDDDG